MKSKFTTGMLFISAILLAAFIWFIERDTATTYQQELRGRTLFSVDPQNIHLLQMERGDVKIECTKASGEWRMSRPADAPVNVTVVERMIAGMASVERGELINAQTLSERNLTPADYGFDEPRARITFRDNRGSSTWLIGRDAPLGDMLYVKSTAGDDIIAASKNLLNLVPENPSWIRDHTLFAGKAGAVRGIDLQRAAGFVQLRQTDAGSWMMQQPHESRADRVSVNTLIENILSAQIGKFIVDEQTDLTIYGLEDPAIELSLFMDNGKTQTLRIGKPVPDSPEAHYAKWVDSYSVFTVPAEWAAKFEIDSNTLRNRSLVDEPLDRISSLLIATGENQIELLRTNDQWQVMRPALWIAESAEVRKVLEAIDNTFIMEFLDEPDAFQTALLDNASWTITFGTESQKHTLRISQPLTDGSLLVRRDNETFSGIIGGELFDAAFRDALFFRNRTVLQVKPEEIHAVKLTAGENEFRIEKTDGEYTAADPAQQADFAAMSDLTLELTELRAGRYVAFNPDSLTAYGLDTPTARLSITLAGTNILGRVILFGNDADDGRYAMLQGEPVVFVLPERSVAALTQELTKPIETETKEIEQP